MSLKKLYEIFSNNLAVIYVKYKPRDLLQNNGLIRIPKDVREELGLENEKEGVWLELTIRKVKPASFAIPLVEKEIEVYEEVKNNE